MATDLLCLTALTLGVRHGFDFDHVTAIADLVGTKLAVEAEENLSEGSLKALKYQSCGLAVAYAGGHAAVVAMLGLGALFFRAVLPSWIDPLMEKVVGFTLIALGGMMLASLKISASNQYSAPIKSRGMLLLSAILRVQHGIESKLLKKNEPMHYHDPAALCNWQCATTIGVLHGIGAETGTQVLLLAALPGAGSVTTSIMMLSSFVIGMLLSSTALACMLSEGYSRLLLASRWMALLGAAVAAGSIIIGFEYLFGYSSFQR